ncbi:hypothetical protein Tco_0424324 [Tanacetum coccineum]
MQRCWILNVPIEVVLCILCDVYYDVTPPETYFWLGPVWGCDRDHPQNTKKIIQIKSRIQAACGCQKSYADVRCKTLKFQVGDRVVLKVSPWKGVTRFGKRGKLNLRYIGPFKILDKVKTIAYRLELPQQLSKVHNTFHVSNLKKCLSDESLVIPLDEIQIGDKLHFVEEPVEIMNREVERLKKSRIPIVKVRWNSRRGLEFMWERKDQFRSNYPHLFVNTTPEGGQTSVKGSKTTASSAPSSPSVGFKMSASQGVKITSSVDGETMLGDSMGIPRLAWPERITPEDVKIHAVESQAQAIIPLSASQPLASQEELKDEELVHVERRVSERLKLKCLKKKPESKPGLTEDDAISIE